MQKSQATDIVISGMGVVSAIGCNKEAFSQALFNGEHASSTLKRSGRENYQFLGAEILEDNLKLPESISKRNARNLSLSGKSALIALDEAYTEAKLDRCDEKRIGIIIGGSNFQARKIAMTYEKYQDKSEFISPSHAMNFWDTDLCGICTEEYSIKGIAYSLGGASASGQLAVIKAVEEVQSGRLDYCIAIGALMDLSVYELQSFRSIGAMGSDHFKNNPELACRPFDKASEGFIYGENCGAIVVETMNSAQKRDCTIYSRIAGTSVTMDGNRSTNSSKEGEKHVISESMKQADFLPTDIDYVNPHGTGSNMGDEIELNAIAECKLSNAIINTTKSITGHGLTSAGTI